MSQWKKFLLVPIAVGLLVIGACTPRVPTVQEELALAEEDLLLGYGETAILTFTGGQPTEVDWTSDDPRVVEVDQKGEVRAVGPGRAVVTAHVGDQAFTCTVQVPLKLLIHPERAWLRPGEQLQLQVSPIPMAMVSWSASEYSSAAVDQSGLVTASDYFGQTLITASAYGVEVSSLVTVYKILTLEEALAQISQLEAPKQSLLGDSKKLLPWLSSLEDWRVAVASLGDEGVLCSRETLAAIKALSQDYLLEPIGPTSFQGEEVLLPEGAYHEWEYSGIYESSAGIVLAAGRVTSVQVKDGEIVIQAELQEDIGATDSGEYTITYQVLLQEDGSFRLGQCTVQRQAFTEPG